jgi:hypothetical protein
MPMIIFTARKSGTGEGMAWLPAKYAQPEKCIEYDNIRAMKTCLF